MTIGAVVGFLEATGSDDNLKGHLVQALHVGDGDVSSAAELDENETAALLGQAGVDACALAADHGFEFSLNELHAVVGAFQRFQNDEISADRLVSILGLPSLPSADVQEAVVLTYRGINHRKATSGNNKLDVVRFVEATGKDEDLRSELQSILQAGDGDISDFSQLDEAELEALRSARGSIVADFAAKHGYSFTIADLFSITDGFQRVKSGELSEEAFENFVDASSQSADFLPFIESITTMTYKGFPYDKVKPAVAQGNSLDVVRFMEKSHDDDALRSTLQELIGGDGDISSPEELDGPEAINLMGEKAAKVVSLAATEGYRFNISDLSAVIGAFQLVEQGTLSLDSCKRILGIGSARNDDLSKVGTTAARIYRGFPVSG